MIMLYLFLSLMINIKYVQNLQCVQNKIIGIK